MFVSKLVTEDDVILDLSGDTLDDAIREVVDLAYQNGYIKNKRKVAEVVLEKERMRPTLVSDEVVVPHIASDEFKKERVLFARSRKGIPVNGKNVRFLFFVGVPKKKKGRMFDIISDISMAVKDKEFVSSLRAARNIDDVLFALQQKRLPVFTRLKRRLARIQAALA